MFRGWGSGAAKVTISRCEGLAKFSGATSSFEVESNFQGPYKSSLTCLQPTYFASVRRTRVSRDASTGVVHNLWVPARKLLLKCTCVLSNFKALPRFGLSTVLCGYAGRHVYRHSATDRIRARHAVCAERNRVGSGRRFSNGLSGFYPEGPGPSLALSATSKGEPSGTSRA